MPIASRLALTIALGGLAMSTPAAARTLDPAVPADALEISKRVQCGEADGKPAFYHWTGKVFSRVTGEPDRVLFKGEGMNVRQCVTVNDPEKGKGYRMVSREVMLYLDPETGEVVRNWKNPWTDETVEVLHIANDPVNSRPNYAVTASGAPYAIPSLRRQGKWLFMPFEAPLFYTNPLGGEYQDYVGGKYHAMEIFDFAMLADEALDTRNATVYPSVSWVRISDWMPWMKMRGRQGQIVFNAMGSKVTSFEDLPKVLKDEIRTNYPSYVAPPPVDDARPNETTWTVFKKWADQQPKSAPSGH